MADTFACPKCGALNAKGAQWCGQCLTPFMRASPPPPPPPLPPTAQSPAAGGAPAPPNVVGFRSAGVFTVGEGGITWRCSRCDTDNLLAAQVCTVCGASFADTIRPQSERPARDPNEVAMFSLLFPGAGHWRLQMHGQAVARGLLGLWVMGVAIVGFLQGSLLLGLPFLLVLFTLWGLAAHDAYREANGERQLVIIKDRVFTYVVLGLLLLMGTLLAISASGVQ